MLALASKSRLALMLCTLGIALASCSSDSVTLTADRPLERIVVSRTETLLYVESGIPLDDVVSMEPFRKKGLKPGMALTEVVAILGEPDYLDEHRQGRDDVFGFESEDGDFEVIKQHVSSEGVEVDRWFLRYRPRECSSLVDPRLLNQVKNLKLIPHRVTVFSGLGRKGKAVLEFDQGHGCSAIWWLQQDEAEFQSAEPALRVNAYDVARNWGVQMLSPGAQDTGQSDGYDPVNLGVLWMARCRLGTSSASHYWPLQVHGRRGKSSRTGGIMTMAARTVSRTRAMHSTRRTLRRVGASVRNACEHSAGRRLPSATEPASPTGLSHPFPPGVGEDERP
jgi:hypothetical protein